MKTRPHLNSEYHYRLNLPGFKKKPILRDVLPDLSKTTPTLRGDPSIELAMGLGAQALEYEGAALRCRELAQEALTNPQIRLEVVGIHVWIFGPVETLEKYVEQGFVSYVSDYYSQDLLEAFHPFREVLSRPPGFLFDSVLRNLVECGHLWKDINPAWVAEVLLEEGKIKPTEEEGVYQWVTP